MTFDRAWVLAIAWLPLAWMVFEWRRTRGGWPGAEGAVAWRRSCWPWPSRD